MQSFQTLSHLSPVSRSWTPLKLSHSSFHFKEHAHGRAPFSSWTKSANTGGTSESLAQCINNTEENNKSENKTGHKTREEGKEESKRERKGKLLSKERTKRRAERRKGKRKKKRKEVEDFTPNVQNTTELLTLKSQTLYGTAVHLPVLPPYVGLEVFHNDVNDFWKKQGKWEGIGRVGSREVYKYIDIYHKSIYWIL